MAFIRHDQQGGDGGSGGGFKRDTPPGEKSFMQKAMDYMQGSYNNLTNPEEWKRAWNDSPEVNSVMHPVQGATDLLRTSGDTLTFGLNDRLRALAHGTTHEQEKALTQAADERLGSWNEAVDLGMFMAQPSAAAKFMPEGAGVLTKAGRYGAEGAGLSGLSAEGHGDPNVLQSMAWGGVGGAGGSIAADAAGSVANIFAKRRPQFKTQEALIEAGDAAHRGTKAGQDVRGRADLLKDLRMADTLGQQGYKQLAEDIAASSKLTGKNAPKYKVPYKTQEQISEIGNQPRPWKTGLDATGKFFKGGTFWGGIPAATLTAGTFPMFGSALEGSARVLRDVQPKMARAVKAPLLHGPGQTPTLVTPEAVEYYRQYLAKIGAAPGRTQ